MPTETLLGAALAALALLLAGCAAPRPPAVHAAPAAATAPRLAAMSEATAALAPAPPPALPAAPAAAHLPAFTPAAPAAGPSTAASHSVASVLAYVDRLRALPVGELAGEVQRLGESPYSPERALQLALALGQLRQPAQTARAQVLLQRVLSDASGAPLHPLARLVAGQMAEQRRIEEQAERQAQQLRDAQRRIDQLSERLEAVRAIERSLRAAPRPAP